jgi:hypothetical protein
MISRKSKGGEDTPPLQTVIVMQDLERATTENHVVEHQHDDRADHRHHQAVDIQTRDAGRAEHIEQEAADERADDAQNDVLIRPSPVRLTILLPMKPAMSPRTSQAMIDMFLSR